MRPFVMGDYLFPGDIIGVAQDISRKYSPSMMDHLHVEVRRNGVLLDPAKLFELVE
jgi:murein DD-endopeptidase MepM/ murein hydrolase activator NlpD